MLKLPSYNSFVTGPRYVNRHLTLDQTHEGMSYIH